MNFRKFYPHNCWIYKQNSKTKVFLGCETLFIMRLIVLRNIDMFQLTWLTALCCNTFCQHAAVMSPSGVWVYSVVHYNDAILSPVASEITSIWIICSAVCSGAHQRKHRISALLAFARGIHRLPVDSPHKGPVTRKVFPFDDVIILRGWQRICTHQF